MKPRIPEDSAVGKNLFHECSTCETLSCSILKECSLECINAISDEKKCSIYKKGDRILMEGIRSNGVYLIRSGRVKIYKADSDGEDFIIRLAGQGEVFGFSPDAKNEEQATSVKALDDTAVCYIDSLSFHRIARKHPELLYGILKFYNRALNEIENKSIKLARMTVVSKIADALVTIFETFGSTGENATLNLKLSRQEIANLTGTTKEQVSKTLSDFSTKGLIFTKAKQIDIRDIQGLKKIARI